MAADDPSGAPLWIMGLLVLVLIGYGVVAGFGGTVEHPGDTSGSGSGDFCDRLWDRN